MAFDNNNNREKETEYTQKEVENEPRLRQHHRETAVISDAVIFFAFACTGNGAETL